MAICREVVSETAAATPVAVGLGGIWTASENIYAINDDKPSQAPKILQERLLSQSPVPRGAWRASPSHWLKLGVMGPNDERGLGPRWASRCMASPSGARLT
ncbi:hypothetical protein AAFF_G00015320 [Aldrovandia affinis]|uniref:Uncharacterized protein n=1 Tax=Aldrovandia affinis TaxID=143900 RepID=A0AAD7S677_9TELE|nr:hypothetical protein AAFF_G00015320 [Aldrovandia affinis]